MATVASPIEMITPMMGDDHQQVATPSTTAGGSIDSPAAIVELWEKDLLERYPQRQQEGGGVDEAVLTPQEGEAGSVASPNTITTREPTAYRDYTADIDASTQEEQDPVKRRVRNFYRVNHINQTFAFAKTTAEKYAALDRKELSVWDAFDFLNTLVDESDPDTDLDQFQHLLQTSEAMRRHDKPDWMVLVGLMHDLGKVLCLFGEPQWAVVGDTFPVGCAFSNKIIYSEYFSENSDSRDPSLNTECGVYERNCGLRSVTMSWGHDEYIYQIMKDCEQRKRRELLATEGEAAAAAYTPIPEAGLYMLRYHSFYSWHREGQYTHLMDAHDAEMLPWVKAFNPFDLYSKCETKPDWEAIKPYYTALIGKYLPSTIRF